MSALSVLDLPLSAAAAAFATGGTSSREKLASRVSFSTFISSGFHLLSQLRFPLSAILTECHFRQRRDLLVSPL